jgi:hypothetical protein
MIKYTVGIHDPGKGLNLATDSHRTSFQFTRSSMCAVLSRSNMTGGNFNCVWEFRRRAIIEAAMAMDRELETLLEAVADGRITDRYRYLETMAAGLTTIADSVDATKTKLRTVSSRVHNITDSQCPQAAN